MYYRTYFIDASCKKWYNFPRKCGAFMKLEVSDVTMTNDLIRGRNNMDECEYKLFCAIVSQIDPFVSNGNKVCLEKREFYDLLGLKSNNKYNRWIKKAFGMMEKSKIIFERDGKIQGGYVIQWVEDKGEVFEFTIATQIMPELERLNDRQYARWLLKNTANLKSAYAMKLYAYLNSWQDKKIVEVSYKWLRDFFMIGEKYSKKQDFERRCIIQAVAEINEKTNIFVEWKPKKAGGKTSETIGYIFKFDVIPTRCQLKEMEWERIRDTAENEIDQFRLQF